ncbi:MAG: queuosine precursor transporter [Candidatus Hydrogenedentes bacterium]|nr:queuosine precursor transporter [Candidatus Hydrogenedentota bacterium]
MIPEAIANFFAQQQNLLWIFTVCADLGMTLLLFRFFGRQGLYAVIVLNIILMNLQGPKLTTVFGMETSLGMIIYSGIYFATDLLSEKYGKREAHRAVMMGFATSIIVFAIMSISLLFLPTRDPDKAAFAASVHEAIALLFGFSPRFVLGSLFAYFISQHLDVWTYHYLREKTQGRMLWLRNNASTMSSQLVDTALYSTVVWWGLFDFQTALELAFAKYFFKVIIAAIDTPFIYWARTWDVSDRDWVDTPREYARAG